MTNREIRQIKKLSFSGHAYRQMFARRISPADVRAVIHEAEIIMEYPDDKPLPSCLILGYVGHRPLHAVVGYDSVMGIGHVVTAYEPDPKQWSADFRARRHS